MNADAYLAKLPADRRAALAAIRTTINANLPAGYEEGVQFGMISWFVPLSRYPDTHNKQPLCLAALASQKHHMAIYLMTVCGHAPTLSWFKKAYIAAGKQLEMGKSCVRFKKLEHIPLEVIGELIGKIDVDTYVKTTKAAHAKPAKKPMAKPKKPTASRRKR